MYRDLKSLHILLAAISLSGFALRAWWSVRGSALLQTRIVRVAPHIVDTLFLGTAIGLVSLSGLPILETGWLLAKIIGLLVYIGAGMVAVRFGRSREQRLCAALLAILSFVWIVGIAIRKSPLGWLQPLAA